MSSQVLGQNVALCNYLPEYENHTSIYCFPSTAPNQQGRCTLLTNELKNLKHSGSVIVVPHLPGYSYLLAPSSKNCTTLTYLSEAPSWIPNFDHSAELYLAEVSAPLIKGLLYFLPPRFMLISQLSGHL